MGSMDELLPPALFDVLTIGLNILGILAVILAIRPWVILPTLALSVVFVLLRRFYIGFRSRHQETGRDCQVTSLL